MRRKRAPGSVVRLAALAAAAAGWLAACASVSVVPIDREEADATTAARPDAAEAASETSAAVDSSSPDASDDADADTNAADASDAADAVDGSADADAD